MKKMRIYEKKYKFYLVYTEWLIHWVMSARHIGQGHSSPSLCLLSPFQQGIQQWCPQGAFNLILRSIV